MGMSLQADHALEAWLCDQCNKTYTNLGQHLRRCRPDRGARAVPAQPIPDLYRPDPTADLLNIAKEEMCHDIVFKLCMLRFERSLDDTSIGIVKSMIKDTVKSTAEQAFHRLGPLLKDGVSPAQVEAALETSVFDGVETRFKELSYLAKNLPILKPRIVRISKKKSIASFSMIDLATRALQEDPQYRRMARASSDRYKTGDMHNVQATHLSSIEDGHEMRSHPHALRKRVGSEARDLVLLFGFNCDDVEVTQTAALALPLPCH